MRHVYTRKTGALTLADGAVYQCSCKVRNLENGLRRKDEVVRTVPERKPYSPQPFPPGLWTITAIEHRADCGFDRGVYGDVKIRTNAWQMVDVWKVDFDGDYAGKSGKQTRDGGYLLHEAPKSKTTLGCIRLPDGAGREIAARLAVGDELEVL